MKKRFLTVLITACTLAMTAGCSAIGNEEEITIDMNEDTEPEVEATTDDESSEDQAEATQETSASGTATATAEDITSMDGDWYGILHASAKEERGQPDDFGGIKCIVYDISFEGDTLKVSGLLENEKLGAYSDAVHELKLTDSTEFQYRGGVDGPEPMERSKFESEIKEMLDSELGFNIEIENGAVKSVAFCS
ncbi:MAG: hypothetical protein J5802_03365 [Butyrivibrio sp.]|nr:hypothetical protein [Butyrivibrio sp.]